MASEKLKDLCGRTRVEKWLFRGCYIGCGILLQFDPTLSQDSKLYTAAAMVIGAGTTLLTPIESGSSAVDEVITPSRPPQDTPVM